MNSKTFILLRTLVIFSIVTFASSTAYAARFPAIINVGSELFEVAPLPKSMPFRNVVGETMQVEYKCQHVGLFWADIWTWDCGLVAIVSEHEYAMFPDALVAELAADPAYAFGNAKRGFWNHYAFWTPFIIAGMCLAFFSGLIFILMLKRLVIRNENSAIDEN